MRLTESIRTAEKKGLANVRRRMDRAREEWSDMERRIRQKMRVYPQTLRSRFGADHDSGSELEKQELPDPTRVTAAAVPGSRPIISINGEDVPEHELDRKAS
ncbi:MAG TPA: hypothetical protein VFY05_04415 [Candidatus Angelobacter sp.]|nr:hypothetical protein [Candidatus Angelobacter sp.]